MKSFKLFSSLALFAYLLIGMETLPAQTPDTVVVDPGMGTLNAAVNDPANVGKVFKLKRGGVYLLDAIVEPSPDAPFILVGEKTPADQPPAVLQRHIPPGSATWQRAIQAPTDVTLENIAIVGYTPVDEQYRFMVRMTKSQTHLTINNCFLQGLWGMAFHLVADSVSVDFTNNYMHGILQPTNWQNGWLYHLGGTSPGLIRIVNNTFMFQGSVIGYNAGALVDSVIFDHNTVVFQNREWFYADPYLNAVYTNNIFYNCAMRGFVGPRPQWGYEGDYSDDADGDSLVGLVNIDTLGTWIEGVDDNERTVIYSNNLRYTTQQVLDFQKETTATYQPTMNEKTKGMFANFPKMTTENNMEETLDPDFVQLPPESALDPYFAMVKGKRDTTLRTAEWPQDWAWDWDGDRKAILSWPPPVNLKPQAASLVDAGSDGYPLGDLNWYGQNVVDAWEQGLDNPLISGVAAKDDAARPADFVLSQNYPNPFNPVTTIGFQISEPTTVSLTVVNMLGQKVRTLINNRRYNPGRYDVKWNGRDDNGRQQVTGVYFYRLETGNSTAMRKMIMIK